MAVRTINPYSIARISVRSVAASILVFLGSCTGTSPRMTIYDGSRAKTVPQVDAERLTHALEQLLVSCTFDSTAGVGAEEMRRHALSGPHIRVAYAQARSLHVMETPIRTDEVLLPLPPDKSPDHLYIRDAERVLAYAKYRPDKLADLVCDEALGSEIHSRFAWLCEDLQPLLKRAPR